MIGDLTMVLGIGLALIFVAILCIPGVASRFITVLGLMAYAIVGIVGFAFVAQRVFGIGTAEDHAAVMRFFESERAWLWALVGLAIGAAHAERRRLMKARGQRRDDQTPA